MQLPRWLKKDPPQAAPPERMRMLAVSVSDPDRAVLSVLADKHGWDLRISNGVETRGDFEVILCDRDQPGRPWREVLDSLVAGFPGSCVLLVSPVNDDYLWREVVQHGGYDVLTRPLREQAVLHAIQAALQFTSSRQA